MEVRQVEYLQAFATGCFGCRERVGLGLGKPSREIERTGWRKRAQASKEVPAKHLIRKDASKLCSNLKLD